MAEKCRQIHRKTSTMEIFSSKDSITWGLQQILRNFEEQVFFYKVLPIFSEILSEILHFSFFLANGKVVAIKFILRYECFQNFEPMLEKRQR